MARLLLLAEADVKADGLRIGRRDAGAGMASAILPSPTPEFAERKKYFLETAKGKTALLCVFFLRVSPLSPLMGIGEFRS